LQKCLAAALVVLQLGIQKGTHVHYIVDFRFLDVLHPAKHIVVGLFIFGLLTAQFFFDTEVFSLCLFHLGERGVVCQAPGIKLLASSLRRY
jgi:hypothetical protein